MNAATTTCPKCGQPVPADAPGRLCPRCLVAGGFSEGKIPAAETNDPDSTLHIVIPEDSPLPPGAPRKLGDYELVEEIARGGMGIVYKAWQPGLERFVAVKTIRAGLLATAADVERFRREAKAAAKLRHPNIVTIHEIGEQEGQHYFAMDYVPGESLAALARTQPFLPEQAAQITAAVAGAIHYAHQQGVLHRDLKPANVILSPAQGPRVLDFGLARLQEDDSQLTQTGTPMGSPCYMSPEQAAGRVHGIDARTDVYALGAMLYELLTGRPPFQAASVIETLRLVQETEPVTLRRINPSLPADLETICLKCLEKEPAKRYQSAQELSEELSRFGRDERILARPVSQAEKAWRWCRRKPALAGALGAALALLLAVAIGSPIAALRIDRERKRAAAGESSARHSLYAANMNLAQQAWEQNNIVRLRQLLEDTQDSPNRGFEWYYWQRQTHLAVKTLRGHLEWVSSVAFSPDGQRIVTGGERVKVWEAASGRELLTLKGHSAPIWSVAFSPDGQRIVIGSEDETAKVWQAAGAEQVAAWQAEERAAAQSLAALQRERTDEQKRQRIARARDEGAIKRWLVLAPIALATGQSGAKGLDTEQIEGEGQLKHKAGETKSVGTRELKWQEVAQEDYVIDFNSILGYETPQSVAYAVCYIRSEAEQRGLQMLVGSDDQATVYLNGKRVQKIRLLAQLCSGPGYGARHRSECRAERAGVQSGERKRQMEGFHSVHRCPGQFGHGYQGNAHPLSLRR